MRASKGFSVNVLYGGYEKDNVSQMQELKDMDSLEEADDSLLRT